MVLKGVKRVKGNTAIQKAPVTPSLLLDLYRALRLSNPVDVCIWVASLVMFFTLLRRSNVLPTHTHTPETQYLTRKNFLFFPWGVLIEISHTKTIQFKERVLQFPLPHFPHFPLSTLPSLGNNSGFQSLPVRHRFGTRLAFG